MRKPNLPMAALLVALLTAGASAAAPAAKTAARAAAAPMSKADFTAQRVKRIMALDGDGDGKISLAEWSSRRMGPNAGANGRDPAKAFGRLDLNKDGHLDEAELARVSDRAFARLDADRDGQLTFDEQKAALMQRRAASGK